jgi:hypothetical protein
MTGGTAQAPLRDARLLGSPRRALPGRKDTLAVVRLPLPEALEALLALLDERPSRYERAALAWYARLVRFAPELRFAEARAGLDALAALPTPAAQRAAVRLARVCARAGLEEVVAVLDLWRHEHSPIVISEVDGPRSKPRPWAV